MAQFTNVIEILNLLEKSNCKKCGEKTCMVFAAAVLQGKKQLGDCPQLPREQVAQYGLQEKKSLAFEEDFERFAAEMTQQLKKLDFRERAQTIGGEFEDDSILLSIMGKPLRVDKKGQVSTTLHVNSWVLGTVLSYINFCKGVPLSSRWVPLRELPSGQDWFRLFGQQCEVVLKKTADNYTELFDDLIHMFSGKKLKQQFDADIAIALYPLPLVPILICFWKPEEGMDSELKVFFDDTAEENLGIDGVYTLGVGIAMMLEKLAWQHGGKT